MGSTTGHRFHGLVLDAVVAVGMCVVGFAFAWPFILMGLAAGSDQATNGMSMLAFPFVFVFRDCVPASRCWGGGVGSPPAGSPSEPWPGA